MKSHYLRFTSLLFAALILTGCFGAKSPQDVTREFWEAVITQNVDNIIEHSTLVDASSYDSFNKKWEGYQLITGKIVIDDNKAEVETELSRMNDAGKNNQKLNTYLIKQNGKWVVDYIHTAESLKGDVFDHFLGQMEQLGKTLSNTLYKSSEKFSIEMQRLEDELKAFAGSSSDEANKIIEKHGKELKKSIKELAESIDRALKEHNEDLSEEEKRRLLKVSDDLNKNQQTLSQPTISNINQSSHNLIQVQQQLDEINNKNITGYKKQWHDWQYSFERDMQSLLGALSAKQKN
ncbi:MAG: hypothetical protein KAT06_12130 [Gammaproteobacteria bacterium]|nr:hypothetical protein [Gammaproteobacteria bacterium]